MTADISSYFKYLWIFLVRRLYVAAAMILEDVFESQLDRDVILREGSARWCVGMGQLEEDSDDLEAGYISSDESAHAADLAERLRVKPSKDIWELEDIRQCLNQLPFAEEISGLLEAEDNDEVISLATSTGGGEGLRTAALWACWQARSSLLAALLKLGVDPNATDDAGRTCLHLSCLVGSEECTHMLLEHKADPNRWDSSQDTKATPLHCAASAKSLACVKVLIAYGADVNAGLSEKSPLHYAVLSNAPEVVSALLEAGACPDTPQVFTETPLHVAATLGLATCTKLLLDAGADVRAAMGPGRATALHLAAEDGHAECAELLLEHGANIDWPNLRGQTPLHLAALAQSVEVVELLVGRRADVLAQDVDGRTPLHGSIVRGARACDVARLLLSSGADPNAPDNFGYTPLHIAALNEFSACVLLLLDYGGDVTLRTNGGVSVLAFIVRRVPDVVPRYLEKFDDAVHVSEHELGDVDCELTIDFRPLVPCLSRGEAELLLAFIEVGHKEVLKHPLAETFLFLKWRRIRKFFVLSFIYHALFITLYSLYILLIFSDIFLCEEVTCDVPSYLKPVQGFILLLNICFLGKEIFQACLNWSAYIRQWENWLQLMIILGVFLCTVPNRDTGDGIITKHTSDWQHDFAAITIFFCWLELMMIIGRFPTFGLYVQMFTTVTVNFATFLLAYSCLLIAFGLAFSVLFSNYPAFHLPAGLVKTVMMMSGELEYEDIFYNNCTNSQIQYPLTAHGMFLIFVLLVTVILTNLLVGLAVSDIQALQESAGLDRLVRMTELVAHLESMLFSSLLSCAPKQLISVLRWGALLTASHTRTLNIRPNDPRENRIPKDLIASVYKLVASRKNRRTRSIRKNNNYEVRLKQCKEEDPVEKQTVVKRKSNLFDRYSFDSQNVERRKRTTSGTNRPMSLTVNAIQDICMTDIKNQLADLTKKINKLVEHTELRLNNIESKMDNVPP
ncbi:transient receptor potential channel pyrexia isoform X3 [Pectinophora gossypiella]|uniref:transient receptor potential channel pyrexia isoform X3 n=1 Tax=Pectinophora gossypiella TaxID=13191 RepID=UPI00214E4F05|nr:transient receptor potential channel pyrexia isoform X3 [Pectinophora gossypiella]